MTNPQLVELIRFLRRKSRENDVRIWRDIAERLARPRRRRLTVNLSQLNRHTEINQTAAVPGKVLSVGELGHPITIAAFEFSEKAREKITASKGKCVSFFDLIEKNPRGSDVKILG